MKSSCDLLYGHIIRPEPVPINNSNTKRYKKGYYVDIIIGIRRYFAEMVKCKKSEMANLL